MAGVANCAVPVFDIVSNLLEIWDQVTLLIHWEIFAHALSWTLLVYPLLSSNCPMINPLIWTKMWTVFCFASYIFLQEPFSNTAKKHLCCWCCKSGPISVRASVDKRGFYLGDTVEVSGITAQNMSKRNLGCIRVSLNRVIYLKADDGQV